MQQDGAYDSESPQTKLGPGELLDGRYEIEADLAVGERSGVYQARDRVIGRRVAVKLLEIDASPPDAQTFREMGRAMAHLNSVHTVRVFDVGEDHGMPYVVLEMLRGRTLGELHARLKKKHRKLTIESAAEIAAGVLRSLAEAHDGGLKHGSIRPSHVVLARTGAGELTVKLIGYGAQVNPEYMSPEQVQGGAVESPSDLYGLGVLLYRGLAGKLPHEHADDYHLMAMHMQVEPAPLELPGERGPAIARFVHRLLSKQPSARHRSAVDALVALQAITGRRLHAIPHLASLDAELGDRQDEHLVDSSGNPNDFLDAKTSIYGLSPIASVGPAREVGGPVPDKIRETSG